MSGLRKDRKPSRQKQAVERQAKWDALSPVEQIKSLDDRLGPGVGAVKQRAKLAKKLKGNG